MVLLCAFGEAGACHAFAQAAFPDKGRLQLADLLVEKIIRELNQADHYVGGYGRVGVFDALLEGFVIGAWCAVELSEPFAVGVISLPLIQVASPDEIAVVFKEFLQAGPGDIGEFDFGFLRGAGSVAAFQNVLFARAGSLDHLIMGAGVLVHEAVAEPHCAIIDDAGFLKGDEVFVAAMRRDKAVGHGFGKGTKGT